MDELQHYSLSFRGKMETNNHGDWVKAEDAEARIAELEDKHHRILEWCKAYPLDMFPEPDFKKVRKLLDKGGVSLGSVSASNMRHVLTGITKILEEQ